MSGSVVDLIGSNLHREGSFTYKTTTNHTYNFFGDGSSLQGLACYLTKDNV